ncbi:cupin domain-containing protein [Sphingomonas sp. MG17]|uniref:Cupin domain-containing protein n=2 Tax=Sphingomonas tagetis TaxID=2949092 RepID=A0A9X2KNK2_9SPHN|nr:cupin domain-containing protein [Sphingomonas tagetis]
MPLNIRRLVTRHDAQGASCVASDGAPPVCSAYEHIPGMMTRLVWATSSGEPLRPSPADPTSPSLSHVPAAGESRFLVVTFPPDRVFAAAEFDGAAAAAENARLSPGLAELFEETGFHRTDSTDYGIVLDGQITLELSDGSKTRLNRHDVIVQNGTRHAWRNETDRPATLAFILIGASRAGE